ncbi:MAG: hypothetical protein U9N34_00385 [Candidatus Cloacimonadota bacterium]|nr:hypothetical protein [Candidatus Cloacimonadota bacterium]
MDLKCPSECSYSLKKQKKGNTFLNFTTKVDSIFENYELMKRQIDRWFVMPSKEFSERIPYKMANTNAGKKELKQYFDNMKIPQNIPVDYLYKKIGFFKKNENDNYETVSAKFLDVIIEQNWEETIKFLHNQNIYEDMFFKQNYIDRIKKNKEVKKIKNYDLLASALSEKKDESMVLFEINRKKLLLISLRFVNNTWKIKQKLFGDFETYYGLNKAIQLIAVKLSKNQLGNVFDDLKNKSKIYPDNPDIMYYWGIYYSMSEDLEKALLYFLTAYELDQNFEQAIYNIGFIYQAKKNNEESKKWYKKVLEINSEEHKSLNNLSVIYEEEGNYIKSFELIKECLEANPSFEHAQKNYIRLKKIVEEK